MTSLVLIVWKRSNRHNNNEIKARRGQRKEEIMRRHTSTLNCTGEEQSRSCESEAIPDPRVKHTNAPTKGERNPEP